MTNKIAIPTLLVATIMVAGMFAFVPVEQASTVHTSSTTTLAADSVSATALKTDAVTEIRNTVNGASTIIASTFATGAIDATALNADAVTKIATGIEAQTGTNNIATGVVATLTSDIVVVNVTDGEVARGNICVNITDVDSSTIGLVRVDFGSTTLILINNVDSESGACAEFVTDTLTIVAPGSGGNTVDYVASWVVDDA